MCLGLNWIRHIIVEVSECDPARGNPHYRVRELGTYILRSISGKAALASIAKDSRFLDELRLSKS